MTANGLTTRNSAPASRIHYIRPTSYVVSDAGENLSYNGGPVMVGTAQVYAIFWEPTGSTVSSNYNNLILRYFRDVGGTGLYANNSQYTDTTGTAPSNATLAGSWVDTSSYPSSTLQDSDVQNEVTNAQKTNGWTSANTHVFFVFTAQNETWLRTNKWKRRPIRSSMPGPTPVGRKLGTNATSHLQQRQVTVPMSIGMAILTLFRKNGTIRKAVVLLLVRKGHVLADLTQCEIGSGVHRAAVLRQRFPFFQLSRCHRFFIQGSKDGATKILLLEAIPMLAKGMILLLTDLLLLA